MTKIKQEGGGLWSLLFKFISRVCFLVKSPFWTEGVRHYSGKRQSSRVSPSYLFQFGCKRHRDRQDKHAGAVICRPHLVVTLVWDQNGLQLVWEEPGDSTGTSESRTIPTQTASRDTGTRHFVVL